jgi:hypothetical protein
MGEGNRKMTEAEMDKLLAEFDSWFTKFLYHRYGFHNALQEYKKLDDFYVKRYGQLWKEDYFLTFCAGRMSREAGNEPDKK